MSKLKIYIASLILAVAAIATPMVLTSQVSASPASDIKDGVNKIGGDSKDCKNSRGQAVECTLTDQVKSIVNVLLFIIGAVAVIMIIIGGLRYVISAGDTSAVTAAKNTILYAVVGLVVAILAFAIVNFVLDALQ